ncbi:hypothetical protein BH09BAC4_BH09BAC4_04780 [soil metagenome]
MAKQAQLRNKVGFAIGLLLLLVGCHHSTPAIVSIPNVYALADQPGWQRQEGRLWLKKELFSGWQYQLWPNGDTAFVGAFREGRAEGKHRHWHANHQPKEVRQYQNGWQQGEQRGWYESGKPAFIYHFQNDVYEGSLKEWYPNGRLARNGNYHEGHENGPQKIWFAEGVLKANYVARNGRNYGFTGVKNCVNVWDSLTGSH